MRTTVTLEPQLAQKVKDLAHRRKTSFKAALNDLVRRGLSAERGKAARERFVVRPHRGGFRPGIDTLRLNQLGDELEVEAFAATTRGGQ